MNKETAIVTATESKLVPTATALIWKACLYEWTSVEIMLPPTNVDCLVHSRRTQGSEGGPYLGIAMLFPDGIWRSSRSFDAKDDLGELVATGHRRIDIRREWHGANVAYWMAIERPEEFK